MPKDRTYIPETPRQAAEWERTLTRYLKAGLCYTCAAQAAWGHQVGFAFQSSRDWKEHRGIKPPCPNCATTVAAFPKTGPKNSPWRILPRTRPQRAHTGQKTHP